MKLIRDEVAKQNYPFASEAPHDIAQSRQIANARLKRTLGAADDHIQEQSSQGDVMADIDADSDALRREEDNELRLLTWFELAGSISEATEQRIAELRARDRRNEVRDPRSDPAEVPPPLHSAHFGIRAD